MHKCKICFPQNNKLNIVLFLVRHKIYLKKLKIIFGQSWNFDLKNCEMY